MQNIRKCAIAGCGNVGATTAYTLMLSGMFSEIILLDIDRNKAEGEAEDIAHGMPFHAPAEIRAGTYGDIEDAFVLIITAGANQRPGQTRLDLVNGNVRVFSSVLTEVRKSGFHGIILVVTNPVDVLTYAAIALSGFPAERVIGSGTVLDTARMKQLLGDKLGVDSRNVHSFIIGEHGDSEVAVWSSANVSGIDLKSFRSEFGQRCTQKDFDELFESVRDSAYRIIRAKGATCYAIAEAVRRIVSAIVRDEHTILTVSTLIRGHYGLNDVCLGVPCVIGAGGIEQVLDIPLDSREKKLIENSAYAIKEVIRSADLPFCSFV